MELQTKENSIQELKNENVEKEERILTKKDVTKSWWLWWLSVEVSNTAGFGMLYIHDPYFTETL